MARIILHTGKSQMGETTIAGDKVSHSAELGYRTVILNTDAIHNLADSFDISPFNSPQHVAPNLWGYETSISRSRTLDAYRCTIQKISNKDEEV